MEQAYLQQSDRRVLLDAYGATIHDKEFVPNKPEAACRFQTVHRTAAGPRNLTPARMLCAGGFNQVGQALSWDFRLLEPGTYEVAVIRLAGKKSTDGRLRATVAGQSVENSLQEREQDAIARIADPPSRVAFGDRYGENRRAWDANVDA